MLERKRSSLIRVALQAGLFICRRLMNERGPGRHPPRRRECAVRVVAVRTIHKSLVHAMLERHRKVRANIRMAAITERWLLFGEQVLRRCGFVHGMARRTRYAVARVRRRMNISAAQRIGMAAQAGVIRLLGRWPRKGNNRRLASVRFHMRGRWPMASFASRILRLLLTAGNTSKMRILVGIRPDIGMARFANGTAGIGAWRRCAWLRRYCGPSSDEYNRNDVRS